MTPFQNPALAAAFEPFPADVRQHLLALRELIFSTAAAADGVGELEETLKWGEPAYLTSRSGSGSTLRLGWNKKAPTCYAIYFNCHTNLVDTFRSLFPDDFQFEGNRALVFQVGEPVPHDALIFCIGMALTYHLDNSRRQHQEPRS